MVYRAAVNAAGWCGHGDDRSQYRQAGKWRGNTRQEYFINGTQPTEYSVHDVGTTIMDNGESHELF